jgi:hypothetical protein
MVIRVGFLKVKQAPEIFNTLLIQGGELIPDFSANRGSFGVAIHPRFSPRET